MRAQGLPISTIIIAALGIIVLVVLSAVFMVQTGKFTRAAGECPGRCYKLNPPAAAIAGQYVSEGCNPEFETKLSGTYIPRDVPSNADPKDWRCDQCCLRTG